MYQGDGNYGTSTSNVVTQRVVNADVKGIWFTNVKVNNTIVSPTCTGTGTGTLACTVTGGNGASLSANVQFVNVSNVLTAYSAETVTGSTSVETKNGTTAGTLSFATDGSVSAPLTGSKNGNDYVYFTVTYTDSVNTLTATLKMN